MTSMRNIVASTVFLAAGVLIFVESFKIRLLRFGSALGGDFFPKMLSVCLIVLSSVWLLLSVYQFVKRRETQQTLKDRFVSTRAILFVTVFSVYIVSLKWMGFTIPTIILAFMNYLLLKDKIRFKDLLIGIGYSIAATFLIWFLFGRMLGLVLPKGVLL